MTMNAKPNRDYPIAYRYPVERRLFTNEVGRIGQDVVEKALMQLGFVVSNNHVNGNGVDILFWDEGANEGKLEVFNNYKDHSYIGLKRAYSIRKNLRGCKRKGLTCGFYNVNENVHNRGILKKIPTLELGFQVLPKPYYYWFEANGLRNASLLRMEDENTVNIVRELLNQFLTEHYDWSAYVYS